MWRLRLASLPGICLYRQRKGWLSVILCTRVIITRRRFEKYRTLGTKSTE
ncbi:hypothetical protein Gogos_003398 [Gossypium gossypioides]|uniref:Uncharacterized protein n=1 Tax=Gossypium gossypioides TaxID=34282 RepID=A0A7J9CLT0_GOSGO|nr:hypothetical protein [Gossypium gossypioides]